MNSAFTHNHVLAKRLLFALVVTLGLLWVGAASASPTSTRFIQRGLEQAAPCATNAYHSAIARDLAFTGQDGFGTLNVNSTPPTRVYIDGVAIGTTPLRGLRISVGKHRVELVNKQHGIRSVSTISVRAGETKTISYP